MRPISHRLQGWLAKLRILTLSRKNCLEKQTTQKDASQYDRALFKLAPELWFEISSFLPLEDVVSLASTCKPLLETIGPKPFEDLKKPEYTAQRVRFLVHSVDAFPRHTLCSRCGKFHKRRALVASSERASGRNPKENQACFGSCKESEKTALQQVAPQFNPGIWTVEWETARDALRALRAGSGSTEVLHSLWRDGIRIDCSHQSVRAHVCDNHLLMRFQTVFPVVKNSTVRTFHRQEPCSIQSRCRHMASPLNYEYKWLMKCAKKLGRDFRYWSFAVKGLEFDLRSSLSSDTWMCTECPSEYHLRLVGNRLVFTRWVDLGECLSEPSEEYKALSEGQVCCKMWTPNWHTPYIGSAVRDWSQIPRISTRFDYAGLE